MTEQELDDEDEEAKVDRVPNRTLLNTTMGRHLFLKDELRRCSRD